MSSLTCHTVFVGCWPKSQAIGLLLKNTWPLLSGLSVVANLGFFPTRWLAFKSEHLNRVRQTCIASLCITSIISYQLKQSQKSTHRVKGRGRTLPTWWVDCQDYTLRRACRMGDVIVATFGEYNLPKRTSSCVPELSGNSYSKGALTLSLGSDLFIYHVK